MAKIKNHMKETFEKAKSSVNNNKNGKKKNKTGNKLLIVIVFLGIVIAFFQFFKTLSPVIRIRIVLWTHSVLPLAFHKPSPDHR